jgi:hypothetical protein
MALPHPVFARIHPRLSVVVDRAGGAAPRHHPPRRPGGRLRGADEAAA